jgi:BirA family biotin operon repressor/biotin-[acetyl-CoA-carboxylase] ligase
LSGQIHKPREEAAGGRHWASPKGKGIYATFIFRPTNPLQDLYYLPVIFSLAVAHLLKNILTPRIKLPNDVVAGDKKIAGVLVEAKATNKKIDFVIVGIGINVNSDKENLPHSATSLYLETGLKYNMEDLFRHLIREVATVYYKFKKRHISELLKDAFLYQESKNLKRIKAEIQKERREMEVVHFL